jgi:predicted RNA-binding protein with PIN domain
MLQGMEPEPTVIVDALNVIRSRWPNLEPDRFVERVSEWARREGVRALIVFDGKDPDGRTGIHELDERTTVVGTGREIADDWIAREAPRLAAEGRPLWLVSSDRGLRARVEPDVERTIGGGTFVGLLDDVG